MKTLSCFLVTWLFFFCALFAEEKNALIITDNGLEMLKWDLDFVAEAQESIDISAVYMGGSVARELLAAIEKRLQEVPTLQVYILASPSLLEEPDWIMINHLRTSYPSNFHMEFTASVAVMWPDITGIDNHAKCFIVDEKYFSL